MQRQGDLVVVRKKKQAYYKFLAGNLKCGYDSEFYYPAPTPKYDDAGKLIGWDAGAWVTMPNAPADGKACGVGFHLMKVLKPIYTRYMENCYEAEGKDLLGEDNEKARFRSVRLIRPVPKNLIFKPKADLFRANLSGADLSRANLSGANLSEANLSGANLSEANLFRANLSEANLFRANLSEANLSGADLFGADLSRANLFRANLSEARIIEGTLSPEQTKLIITPDGDMIIEKREEA
jgi:hypothetical protein